MGGVKMASVDFKKCKGGTSQGAAMISHFTRHDGKEVEYRNKYIDLSRSGENYCVGQKRFEPVPTADEIHRRLLDRVDEIDKILPPKRKRADRVKEMTYTITAPKGLSPEKQKQFFMLAHEELARFSGGRENISVGFVHLDEIHDYLDSNGIKTQSRAHMHVAGIPYVEGVGVNGKQFETRQRMRELNKVIDERCRRELGCRFMTGERGLTGRTVEELQADSEKRTHRRARAKLNREIKELSNNLERGMNQLDHLTRDIDAQRHQIEINDVKIAKQAKMLSEGSERLTDLSAQIGRLEDIRQFCVDRIREIQKKAKKVLSPYEKLRRMVETKKRDIMSFPDGIDLCGYKTRAGQVLYAPEVNGSEFTWNGKTPLYEQDKVIKTYNPAYVMDRDGTLESAYGKTHKSWSVFTPENRDELLVERRTPAYSISENLQREVSRCKSVVADIDEIQKHSEVFRNRW